MQLPFVLQSAETMKAAVAYLEPHMEKADAGGKGTLVIGTVKGDVHDIGKNLVDIILTNNGYEVHNIGIKAPLQAFVDKAEEVEADAIGMSGLLVKSTIIMRENLEELNALGLAETPVLLGGAALTRTYVERDLRELYEGRLFYGKDAFEGLHTMDTLMEGKRTGTLDPDVRPRARVAATSRRAGRQDRADEAEPVPARSDVADDVPRLHAAVPRLARRQGHLARRDRRLRQRDRAVPQPVAVPARQVDRRDGRRVQGAAPRHVAGRARRGEGRGVARPRGGVGLLPGQLGGQRPRRVDRRRPPDRAAALHLPAPAQGPFPLHLPTSSARSTAGEVDYAAFHVVTIGDRATERERELFAADRYQEYLLCHGLSVEMTEALAELWHRRIREEWGFADEDGPTLAGLFRQQYRGSRYSWGYPACPDLEDQAKLDELLDLARIGVAAHRGVPARARAEHLGDHRPPPRGQVLRNLILRSLVAAVRVGTPGRWRSHGPGRGRAPTRRAARRGPRPTRRAAGGRSGRRRPGSRHTSPPSRRLR